MSTIDSILEIYPHLNRAELAAKGDRYCTYFLEAARQGSPHRADARMPVRRQDHEDRDAEFAALIKRFDGAIEAEEAYHRADPWLVGEEAARAAAARYVRAGLHRADSDSDDALAAHFDQVMSGGSAAMSPAGLGRTADPAGLAELRGKALAVRQSDIPLSELLSMRGEDLVALAKANGVSVDQLLMGGGQ